MRYFIVFVLLFYSCKRGNISEYKVYLNHNDTVKYVGKEQCRMCHVEIYDSYIKTGMGRSFHYAVKDYSALSETNMPTIYDTIKNLFYKPFWINDSLYLKEFRLKGLDTTHLLVKKINYKIGSGQHTNSHLFDINGYIHQIPYTYYTQKDIADLPPGYEDGYNSRFSREIGLECMSCHNAYVNHDETSFNKYNTISEGIDCERCHGPGEVHIKRKLAGEIIDTSKYIDYSIVNPSKLPLDLQFDICERCHLQGTSILAEGKFFDSFKPGMHLADFMDTYLPRYDNNHSFIMASHVDRLKQSTCFKESEMACTSCHNPHKSVTTLENTYFDNKCMKCHEICNDKQVENCASCHMPKSITSDIMHVTITDHKIGIHKIEKEKTKENFLGLFSINNNNPTNLSKAKAYLKYFESFDPQLFYLDSAKYYLDRSQNNFTAYIQYFYLINDDNGLINYVMSQNIEDKKYTHSELALAYSRMGEVFGEKKLLHKAEIFHNKAITLMSNVIDYKIKYAAFLFDNNQINKAQIEYKKALSLNPTIKEIHANLGLISMIKGNYNDAESSLKQAIALDPDYILAYENLVLLYDKYDNYENTKLYLRKILEIDPNHKVKDLLKSYNF